MDVRRLALPVVILPLLAAGCGDGTPSTSPAAVESSTSTPTPAPTPSPSAPAPLPDLTEDLIAKHDPGGTRWAREDELVTFPDGSTGVFSRSGDAPVLTVTVDGTPTVGAVPDHQAEGGLAPTPMALDSGGVGYVVHQGGGEFAAMNLMVVQDDELVSVGQACYDIEASAYEPC